MFFNLLCIASLFFANGSLLLGHSSDALLKFRCNIQLSLIGLGEQK
jgi:hypothetical protein